MYKIFPEVKKTLEDEMNSEGFPVYKFSAYVSGITETDITNNELIFTDVFDVFSAYKRDYRN